MKNTITILIVAMSLVSCSNIKKVSSDTSGKNTMQLIRSASLKMNYAGKTFLVDPVFAEKGELISLIGVNRNPTVHLTMPVNKIMDNVEFVLATHSHFDHFDKVAATAMGKEMKLYIQPADSINFKRDYGIVNTQIIDSVMNVGDILIHRTSGIHGNGIIGEKMGEVSGYVLQAKNQPTIYIIGDCLWTDDIKRYIDMYSPDYIIVNSGGAIIPSLSPEFGTLLMNEKDVVKMIKNSPSKCRFIAVHMEAIDHCQTTRSILRNEADYEGIPKEKLIIPADGESVNL